MLKFDLCPKLKMLNQMLSLLARYLALPPPRKCVIDSQEYSISVGKTGMDGDA